MAAPTIQHIFDQALQNHRAGQLAQAEQLYRHVLAQEPGNAEALHLLGLIAIHMGRFEAAVDLIGRAVAIKPDRADAFTNLGVALEKSGRLDEAIDAHRRSVKIQPDYVSGFFNLGNVLVAKGQIEEAIGMYRNAVALNANFPEALNNLGAALKDFGKLDQAAGVYRQAIAVKPDYAEAMTNLGNVLKDQGQLDQAVAAQRAAIAIKPEYADAHYHLGNVLADKGQLESAMAAYREAIRLNPNHTRAYNNLGIVLRDNGQADEAIAAYRQAVAAGPQNAEAHSNLILMMQYHPAVDRPALVDELGRWNRQHALPLGKFIRGHGNDRNPDRRLRVGYVSSDFREHVVGRNLLPLFGNHDRGRFEITCYAQVFKPDEMTRRFQTYADRWRETVGISDERVAEQIREDGIDILVDLGLHTTRNRLLVFARKPAPVQVTFAGYPGSTGLSAMDYRLSDPYLDLPGVGDETYSEKTVRLGESFWCYDPLDCADIEVSALPSLETGIVTFGCLNNFAKINDEIVAVWAKVLGRVAGSRLMLLAPPLRFQRQILESLANNGIESGRVEFAGYRERREYLKLYHRIDIGLDSFPYNGHTTSLDSFWMGVPVVTMVGDRVVSRAGWSQLSNLGMTELAGETAGGFVKTAADLASNPRGLAKMRAGLRGRMVRSPLMDGPGFARNIENAYREMWRVWCRSDSQPT